MLSKITDTASILKAKITKDELEEKLVQATTQQNWQTPTNILHDIANAAYNYEKWQKINDFIWEKLKKKSTWRKIMKTLNLVQFLIKNGPPSAISSFKYDIYQFRSFSDFSVYDDGVDRGQASIQIYFISVRQKSKQIVDLLSNDQLLEQQREKAKKIRERMSHVTGGSGSYGGYSGGSYGGGDGRYESFNSRNYDGNKPPTSYGNSDYHGGLGAYGDYNYGKSTLDKYKNDQKIKKTESGAAMNKPLIVPDITGSGTTADITHQTKKPFQNIAKKLEKPGQKTQAVKPDPPSPNKNIIPTTQATNTANKNIIDVDIFDMDPPSVPAKQENTYSNTAEQTKQYVNPAPVQPQTNILTQPVQQPIQQVQQVQPPQTLPFNQIYNQPYGQPQAPYGYPQSQPQYGQPQYGQPAYGQPQYGQPVYGQPSYGQPYGQPMYPQPFNPQIYNPQPYNQPQYYQPQQQQQQQQQPQQQSKPAQITLQTKSKSQQQEFDKFVGAPSQATANLKWLSNDEKGLIDFSDFNSEIKNNSSPSIKKKQDKGNNIVIDPWKW